MIQGSVSPGGSNLSTTVVPTGHRSAPERRRQPWIVLDGFPRSVGGATEGDQYTACMGLPCSRGDTVSRGLYRTVRGVETRVVVVEDKVRKRDGHRDIDALDEMQAADRQEENLAGIKQDTQESAAHRARDEARPE